MHRFRALVVPVILGSLVLVTAAPAAGALFTSRTVIVEPIALAHPNRYRVAAGDLNNDGLADLIVSNEPNNQTTVLLGNGNATFRAPMTLQAGGVPLLADVNGDGNPDLLLESYTRRDISIYLNSGNATFSAAIVIPSPAAGPGQIALSDLDGDGRLDIVVPDSDSGLPGPRMSVLLGNGDGTFRAGPLVSLADAHFGAYSVCLADFDHDGNPDGVVGLSQNGFAILKGTGNATFGRAQPVYEGQVFALGVSDINGDGFADLLIGLPNGIRIIRGVGDGTFVLAPDNYRVFFSSPLAFTTADVNADRHPDLLFISDDLQAFGVALGDGSGHFATPATFALEEKPISLAVADFNNDGLPDVVVGGSYQQTVTIFLNSRSTPVRRRIVGGRGLH